MIKTIKANHSSFQQVSFSPTGLNIILADRTKTSSSKDSRNGLGKSTLIEIIHFCLGSSTRAQQPLRPNTLGGWEFGMDIDLGGRNITVHRSIDNPNRIELEGDLDGWNEGLWKSGKLFFTEDQWTSKLGEEIFGLTPRQDASPWSPTFRSLIPYFIRRGRDSFSKPFEHYGKQQEWSKQVANAYLLGLSWEDAQEWQVLRDKTKTLNTLKKAANSQLMQGFMGSRGELEAELVRVESTQRKQQSALSNFRIHPEYREIENTANALTSTISSLNNQNLTDRRLINLYREGLEDAEQSHLSDVEKLYKDAGVSLPDMVIHHLNEVQEFHSKVVTNRRSFLHGEIERLEAESLNREQQLKSSDEERGKLLSILRSHGALDEHSRLQQRLTETQAAAKELQGRISNLKRFEEGKSGLKIEQEQLLQRAQRDHEERSEVREEAIRLFNEHSEYLYQSPGRLIIEMRKKGFHFDVEIERSSSQGIGSMKIFCYDLMLSQLRPSPPKGPGTLIHDSTLFDGVDERQTALALIRADEIAKSSNFQYICCLNSDDVPWNELPSDFNLDEHVRLRLTDKSPAGSLLGIRY